MVAIAVGSRVWPRGGLYPGGLCVAFSDRAWGAFPAAA